MVAERPEKKTPRMPPGGGMGGMCDMDYRSQNETQRPRDPTRRWRPLTSSLPSSTANGTIPSDQPSGQTHHDRSDQAIDF